MKKNDGKYGKTINLKQNDEKIIVEFNLHNSYEATGVVLVSKFSKHRYEITLNQVANNYEFIIDYAALAANNLLDISDEYLSSLKMFKEQELVEFYDIFLNLKVNHNNDVYGKNASIVALDDKNSDGFYHLGGFDKVLIAKETTNSKTMLLECSEEGFYGIGIGCHFLNYFEQSVASVKIGKGNILTKGNIKTNLNVDNMFLLLKGRDSFTEYEIPLIKLDKKIIDAGVYALDYEVNCNLNEIVNDDFVEDTYALNFKFISDDESYINKVNRYSFIQRKSIKRFVVKANTSVFYFCPTYTFKAKLLRFQVENFGIDEYEFLKKKVRSRFFDRLRNRNRDIWLISERIYKAQDNGFYLFKYMRENYPDEEVYYVIDKESKEVEKLQKYGNVVFYKSKEHIELTLLASKFISTHHFDYMLPFRDFSFKKKLKGAVVFLQHGVLGTKNMANLYGYELKTFDADAIIASSEKERGYILSDLKFPKEKIHITGQARYDNLFNTKNTKKQIIIIPTWRDWLQNIDKFLQSDYLERYQSLLNNVELANKCQENNIELIFCLHPNMQQYNYLFKGKNVKVVSQGEIDVQTLIKEGALMVTDYSSVAFDFSFLGKPVLYYMFDRDKFFDKTGSHLDIDASLPGRIVAYEDILITEINKYIDNGFVMESKYYQRANEFIKYKDTNNAMRIREVVLNTKKDKSLKIKFKKSDSLKLLGVFYRKNKFFLPTIKIIVKLLKLLPMKKDLVVFESGMGKTGSDNPKALYDVLKVERPELKKVWVSENLIANLDENTIRIERKSLAYYYYLSRAKYWINNQNYPYYMIRRKQGIYLQTWHGTPLKKMFYDLKKIYGRDEGYKKRNAQAINQWSHLLSPNSYTTKNYHSAFRTKAQILELGYPRNDVLYTNNNEDYRNQIKDKIAIRLNKRVILYAPTFRDDQVVGRSKFNQTLMFDYKKMYDSLGANQVLLIRTHMVVVNELIIPPEYGDRIIDVSDYSNIEDLLLISEALITDYSSVFFDYLNLERPIIFYAYDLDKYQDKLRGFYLDYTKDNLPGPIITVENELYDIIKNIDKINEGYASKVKQMKKEYCSNDDGHASKRIIKEIFNK
ncbi:CDP-glycerol glycerophosphotransferase family protein [Erysipelotrichaceae bacterium OttesenSCG-928-M19]|nr:CDP-glycerol glycerophosphotransferase family protein [Erysipelotrichaceae bacterium OttesenSCG-928-M19]